VAICLKLDGLAYMPGSYIFRANFGEPRQGEVRLSAGPMGEDFSGSCTVTSRNPLIHIGATNGTKSERFDAKGVLHAVLECLAMRLMGRLLP
jgi:hypothetical protein